jgi:hypothetical protein
METNSPAMSAAMIIYNALALVAALIGGVCAAAGYAATKNPYVSGLAFAIGAGAFDFWTRLRGDGDGSRFVHPNAGGHIWFAPVWIIAIVGAFIAGGMGLGML